MTAAAPASLLPRQEAFARHVAAGRPLAAAARLAGYAWVGAKQQGHRLMRDPRVAARVLDLAARREAQRQEEIDILVASARQVFDEAMYRDGFAAAMRALDMIARLRGLVGDPAAQAILVAEDEADGDEEDEAARARPEPEPEPEPETDQPAACMPPELPAPLAPVLPKPRVPGPLNPAPAPAQQPNPVALEGDFARLPPRMAEAARRIVASTLTNADFR